MCPWVAKICALSFTSLTFHQCNILKVNVWVLAIALLTWAQQRFTILEVTADWHELMVPRRGMQPASVSDNGQLDLWCSTTDIPPPQSATPGLYPVARRLLFINRPRRDSTLSWRWYTAATGGIRTRDLAIASPALYHTAMVYHTIRQIMKWNQYCCFCDLLFCAAHVVNKDLYNMIHTSSVQRKILL